jgi:hypothetical protein
VPVALLQNNKVGRSLPMKGKSFKSFAKSKTRLSCERMIFILAMLALLFGLLSGCASVQTMQYGTEESNTIALNLTKDPNVGTLFITHVNGEATGAVRYKQGKIPFLTSETVYVNPLYVKLTGKPITFTVQCPVVTGTLSNGSPKIEYKTTELRLTKLSDIKSGEVLTLKWMYQTQTFAFQDATGNIVQQTIPTFN